MAKDLTIAVPRDRSTVMAEVGEALGGAGVNIEGLSGTLRAGELHVLVEDVAAARRAIDDAGLAVSTERHVLLRSLKQRNQAGTWGRFARRLVERGITIEFC